MKDNIVQTENCGIKCDSPACDYFDPSVGFHNMDEWLNKACPKCGHNLLTEQDLFNAKAVQLAVQMANNLTPEQIKKLSEDINVEELKKDPVFKDAVGLEYLGDSEETPVSFSVETHREIKIVEIKPIQE